MKANQYVPPEDVKSPRKRLRSHKVIIDKGKNSWALAKLVWDGQCQYGIRWNGDDTECLGKPISSGHPVWFVLPEEIVSILKNDPTIGALM